MEHDQKFIGIETPRLVLGDFKQEEYCAFFDLFEDLKNHKQTWFNADADRPETVAAFFGKILNNQMDHPRNTYRLAVRKKEDNGTTSLIGYISLCDILNPDVIPDTAVLITPKYQSRDYAREARLAIIHWAFTDLGLEKICCDINPSNVASTKNVMGMGYERQVDTDSNPTEVPTTTIDGIQIWHRFVLEKNAGLKKLPSLIQHLAEKQISRTSDHQSKAQEFQARADDLLSQGNIEMAIPQQEIALRNNLLIDYGWEQAMTRNMGSFDPKHFFNISYIESIRPNIHYSQTTGLFENNK